MADTVIVVSETSHIHHVREQLPELSDSDILVEPARRGTASCILLALSNIKKRGLGDQAVAFLWADHLVRDGEGFCSTVKRSAELAEHYKKLIFIGAEPTYPANVFGYMKKGERLNDGFKDVFTLDQFVEKPDKTTAESYFQSGQYLWNTGYLAGTTDVFETEIQKYNEKLWGYYQALLHAEEPNEVYLSFENEVIEYGLSERLEDALVIPGTFDWVDVGTFQDLHTVSKQDDEGNHRNGEKIELEHTSNSFVRNETDKPVAVIGLDNIAVVVTDNGVLVANKTYSSKVGEVAKRVQGQN